jgi:lipopolysaccharide biosynthesis glycosyltransferase
MEKKIKMAIATVTSQDFVPGTLVLIHSFLKHNPWFDGDIVIICDSLEADQKRLFQIFPKVIFKKPGDDLLLRIGHLCRNLPKILPKRQRFYSIEAFNLKGYDKLLFFDSDMLVTSDLSEIFEQQTELMACSDNPYDKQDRIRDKVSFKRLSSDEIAGNPQILAKTFNAGFMVVDKIFLNNETYQSLKLLINTDIFRKIKTHNTDQVVLNLHFDNKVTFLHAGYNLILSQSPELIKTKKLSPDEIKILHFTGKYKPWSASEKMDELIVDPYYSAFINDWKDAYKEVKQKLDRNKQSL